MQVLLTEPGPQPSLPPKVLWRKVCVLTAENQYCVLVGKMESENTLSSDAGSPELQAARPAPNRTLPSPGKEVRLTLSPEAGTADSEPFALCNFISVQLQISVCLQNYIMCHSPSCYSSKPILCTPICLPACLINPQEGRERERGKVFPIAPFSPLLHLRHPSHS